MFEDVNFLEFDPSCSHDGHHCRCDLSAYRAWVAHDRARREARRRGLAALDAETVNIAKMEYGVRWDD